MLKIVNSPYYGLTNKIASIQRAVNLLGSRSIINLINAQSIKGEMSDETIVTLNRFWDTAQDVAMTCLTLAKRLGSQAVDEAYALGLFHDCGVPLMLKRFPDYMSVLEDAYASANDRQRVVDTENQVFNTNHAVVGYYTAKSWRLPEHVSNAIANHHNALAVFSDESPRTAPLKNLLAILKMAEHICASHRVLGNQGGIRAVNVLGRTDPSTIIAADSVITAGGWGVVSTDGCTTPQLYFYNTDLYILPECEGGMYSGWKILGYDEEAYGSGYGTDSDNTKLSITSGS